jgi:hypothetical protein
MNKVTRLISILGIVSLPACTTSTPTVLPDGTKGIMIACPGMENSMGSCFVKAGQLCPSGYDVINQSEESHPVFGAGGAPASGFSMYGADVVRRNLMVRCH